MSKFILLLHENPADYANVSPSEMEAIIGRYMAWTDSLAKHGKLVVAEKLRDEGGRVLKRDGARVVVVDGPYAEAREVVSGFYVISAESYEDAVAIAKGCPHAEGNGRIEVRQIESLG
jgi:hypothetical protein